mmetsp:Transcript_9388/g.21491  ORF Transcript_9388/g.21491 Transcript_9388/m.21491 type:complete len:184 (+) Transcript_9388:1170-1721(+)
MNNASYLTHAEYARWEWTSENGALQHMYKTGAHFVVSNTSVRFRKEISLADTAFEIHSVLEAIDERHFWMHQTFRSGKKNNDKDNDTHSNSGNGRIMAQVLVQAVAVRNRKVVDPRTVLDAVGVPGETVDSLLWEHDNDAKGDNDNDDTANTMGFMQRFKDLDTAFREEANADDKRLLSSTGN